MAFTKTHLSEMKKDELVELVLQLQEEPVAEERDVYLHSAAGPVHIFHGFQDVGGDIVIENIPEDESGHWAPFYELVVNGQNLGRPEIEVQGG